MLIAMVTIDSITAAIGNSTFDGIQRQVDVTGGRNLATLLAVAVLALVGATALGIARQTLWPVNGGWMLVSTGAIGLAVVHILGLRPGKLPLLIAAILTAVPVFAFLLYELRSLAGVRVWLLLGMILILSNPATEYAENRLTGNPENYSSAGFDHDAWVQLWIITHIQEVTETGSMICILAAVQMKKESLDGRIRRDRQNEVPLH